MASPFDETDFVDHDFQAAQKGYAAAGSAPLAVPGQRPPTREELDDKVSSTQHKLAELKRLQEDLERERANLEEARRRQGEFQMGREEMVNHLTRGLGLLNEAEFAARRDAEQMSKTIADLRESLVKVQAIQDSSWTQETWNVELTRALTIIENARMEWNGARLKWTLLDGSAAAQKTGATEPFQGPNALGPDFRQWCKLGLALTWPLLLLGLIFGVIFLLRS